METDSKIQEFEDYKLIVDFIYPGHTLKGWVNENNFINLYNEDWNELISVMKLIDTLDYDKPEDLTLIKEITLAFLSLEITRTFKAVVNFIKWYNNLEK